MSHWLSECISAEIMMQAALLAQSMLAGLKIGLLFDCFRSIRRVRELKKRQKKKNGIKKWSEAAQKECSIDIEKAYVDKRNPKKEKLYVYIEDFLFCIGYIWITFQVLYSFNNGALSCYVFLGEIIALFAYYKVFHNWVKCIITCGLWQVYTIILWFVQLLIYPFCKICAKIIRYLKFM